MDTVTPEVRSRMMAAVRGRDTKPERAVRSLIHRLGYRFRLQCRDLPGTPDVVLPRLATCFMVHGCFWHRHPGCRVASTPKTRAEFWQDKFDRNVARDARDLARLQELGWDVHVVWECETRSPAGLEERLSAILHEADGNRGSTNRPRRLPRKPAKRKGRSRGGAAAPGAPS